MDARGRIRATNEATGTRIAVLDDDPTGSQTVHGVAAVTVLDPEQYAAGLAEPGSTCFILTNTRSRTEAEAVDVNRSVAGDLFDLGARLGAPIAVVSRGDSTLRGHVIAEVSALQFARREATGRAYDGVLLVPAFIEAGRVTEGDVHWARAGGEWVPVGETEFARDATFGYTASDLKEFVAEKSGAAIAAADVRSIGLDDIRDGGPARVAEILGGVSGGTFVVVNAIEYSDLETVVLGIHEAERAGRSFLYRAGPSFVRALAGLEPRDPLRAADIWPAGAPDGHGLVVAGSHVAVTSRQLDVLRSRPGVMWIELDVAAVADGARRDAHVEEVAARVRSGLASSEVVLFTSRALSRGSDADDSLRLSRAVSAALVDVVRAARAARPAWVVAKGGITSHDVAAHGLGIRRAEVLGQMRTGLVSVFRPVEAAPEAVGVPYVVFAGNVGDDTLLAEVVDVLRGVA